MIDCISHYLGVHNTYNSNKEEIDDHEAIDRNTKFVVLLLVFFETFSTDKVNVFTIRSTTTEIIPGFGVFHFGKSAKEDYTDHEPN